MQYLGAKIGIAMGSVADPLVGGLICAGIAMSNNLVNQVYNYGEEQKALGNKQINAKEIAENIDWTAVAVSGLLTFGCAAYTSFLVDYKVANVFFDVPPSISTTFARDVVVNGIVTTSMNLGQLVAEAIIDHFRGATSKL